MRQHHLDQANRNYRLYTELRERYLDWATTLLFYTAVQFIEAWLLERLPTSSGSHVGMANRMTRLSVPRDVFGAYETLHDLSRTARYGRWQPVLDPQRLDAVYDDEYRLLCRHFGASSQISPPDPEP